MDCTECGKEIKPTEVAYSCRRVRLTAFGTRSYWYEWECPGCYDGGYHYSETPCRGCGRPLRMMTWGHKHVPVCSPECERERHNARRRVEHNSIPCAYCGEEFTQKRSDAKYCSTKCRVYANRAAQN